MLNHGYRLGLPTMRRFMWGLFIVVAAGWATTGCRGKSRDSGTDVAEGAPKAATAPPLLRDDTKDRILTWIDGAGDFHIVQSPSEVPEDGKEHVRVVDTTQDSGDPDSVFVTDLRQKKPDSSYTVTVISRVRWEELGAAKRKARLEALAPVASQLVPASATASAPPKAAAVVIYGAKWCGACREAKKYLAKKGVNFLEKDVDESPTVQAELRAKLAKAGQPPTSSIPVLDIGGRMLVGFSQGAVDAALQAARP